MRIYLSIILVFIITQSYSQCDVTLSEFIEFSTLNKNQLETKAIRNGFAYDHSRQGYYCNVSSKSDGRDLIVRSLDSKGNNVTVYSFYSIDNYLDFKTKLENEGKYLFTENEDNSKTRGYQYKDKFIFLISRTVVQNDERWNIYSMMTTF